MVSIIRETECRKKQTTGLSLIWGVQMAGMNFQTRFRYKEGARDSGVAGDGSVSGG